MKKLILTCFIVLFFAPALFASQDVKYAGFAFVGNFKDIPVNFKYSNALNAEKDKDGRSIFDREVQKFFKDNASAIPGVNLLMMGEDSKTKVAMALAVTREDISVVNIEDVYKLVASLSCDVTFLDFDGMKVVATYPIYLEYIDVQHSQPDETYKLNLIKKLYFSDDFSVLKVLKDRLGSMGLKNEAVLTMKILNVNLEDDAKGKLTVYKDNWGAFESLLAQKFSDALSSKLNVSVLPYAKDYVGGRMSLVFSDAREQNFQIPTSSYGIDLTLRKLTKEFYKEGTGDDAYLFGAYTTVKIYDPDLGKTYWEKKVKFGAVKNIPKLQKSIDDYSIFNEMTGLVVNEIIKKIKEDQPVYKEVITRCLNK